MTLVTPLVAGQQARAAVTAHNATGAPAVLQGWIDFNGNGSLADAGDALAFTPNALVPNGGVSNQQIASTYRPVRPSPVASRRCASA